MERLLLDKAPPYTPSTRSEPGSTASSFTYNPHSDTSGSVTPTTVHSHSPAGDGAEECVWEMVRSKSPPARPAKDPRRAQNEQKKADMLRGSFYTDMSSEEDEDEEGEYVLREAVFEMVAGPGIGPSLSGGGDAGPDSAKSKETVVIQYATRVVSLLSTVWTVTL